MIRKIIAVILCLLPSTMYAQSVFTIKGYGKLFKDGDSIFLSYKEGNEVVIDSTVVKNNYFSFNGSVKTTCKGFICRNDNPGNAEIFRDYFPDVYIEPGNIFLTSTDTLNNSLISGTPLNNDNAELFAALKPIFERNSKIKDIDTFSAKELQDTALVKATNDKLLSLYYEQVKISLEFINQHLNSYVSLLKLAWVAKNSKFLPDVEKSFAKLSPALKTLLEGKDISRRIVESNKTFAGMIAKDFTQPDVNGNLIKLSDFKGQYVLVDFWASWCLPCREEHPNLRFAYEKYKGKNFTILSVSIDKLQDKQKWINAIKQDKLSWKQVSDLNEDNEAARLYGVTTIPANVLLSPTGKILAKDLKGKELLDKLASLL